MARSKRYDRLAYMEAKANIKIKPKAINSVYVIALPEENDLEALEKRLGNPPYDSYQIEVVRRKGEDITVSHYDQALIYSGRTLVLPHPSNHDSLKIFVSQLQKTNLVRSFNTCDLQLLYDCFDSILSQIEV